MGRRTVSMLMMGGMLKMIGISKLISVTTEKARLPSAVTPWMMALAHSMDPEKSALATEAPDGNFSSQVSYSVHLQKMGWPPGIVT